MSEAGAAQPGPPSAILMPVIMMDIPMELGGSMPSPPPPSAAAASSSKQAPSPPPLQGPEASISGALDGGLALMPPPKGEELLGVALQALEMEGGQGSGCALLEVRWVCVSVRSMCASMYVHACLCGSKRWEERGHCFTLV